MRHLLKRLSKGILPGRALVSYRAFRDGAAYTPSVGQVRWGDLKRSSPLSRWGYSRGLPVDRYYIELFLSAHSADIHGAVLEVGDASYTQKFGAERVSRSDVLHVEATPAATIVADLTRADALPAGAFDCIICTQTLQQLFDVETAIRNLFRALKPGGVLLVTVPGISQIDRSAMEKWGDYWRFTSLALVTLFTRSFPENCTKITPYGNVLSSTAFLYGLAFEELSESELVFQDPDYQLLIAVRAVKPET